MAPRAPALFDRRAADGGALALAVALARGASVHALVAMIAGMWWWGFDFGQFFGGVNRKEIEARMAALETENAELQKENAPLRSKTMQQETELAMTSGAQASLSKQAQELSAENAQIKEELAFLQQLVADSNKQVGLSIQRLTVERERDDAWRYRLLLVRGGSPKEEFDGQRHAAGDAAAVDRRPAPARARRSSRCPTTSPAARRR